MSTKVTIEKAFWWAPGMLVSEKIKHHAGCKSWYTMVPLEKDVLTTYYYYDAPVDAMLEYLHDKHFEIDGPFKVDMTVNTKNGEKHVYAVTIGEINFATKDLDDLRDNLVIPTAIKLVRQAANELRFKDVISVTASVEET